MCTIGGRLLMGVAVLTLTTACSKQQDSRGTIDTAAPAAAPAAAPPVAVTTEVAPGVLMTVEAPPGTGLVLADGAGRAVYILDGVPADTTMWRPVTGSSAMTSNDSKVNKGLIGTTTNANGTTQATYSGKPLYYYAGDSASTDRKGQGTAASGATGHLVSPSGGAASGGTGARGGTGAKSGGTGATKP
jgi:predicted lipoprotein with Yx(FWY)xxD motif